MYTLRVFIGPNHWMIAVRLGGGVRRWQLPIVPHVWIPNRSDNRSGEGRPAVRPETLYAKRIRDRTGNIEDRAGCLASEANQGPSAREHTKEVGETDRVRASFFPPIAPMARSFSRGPAPTAGSRQHRRTSRYETWFRTGRSSIPERHVIQVAAARPVEVLQRDEC